MEYTEKNNKSGVRIIRENLSSMFCWGSTVHGELGMGFKKENVMVPTPHRFKDSNLVDQVFCGIEHTILITKTGELYSCGKNDRGQLGQDKSRSWPSKVEGLDVCKIVRAACGAQHSLVCDEWGQLYAWGSDAFGQLGMNGVNQSHPKLIKKVAMHEFIQISCGHHHSLGLTNAGDLYSWGSNAHGQLGLGSNVSCEKEPVLVKSLHGIPIAFIASGSNHSFALSKSGAIYGWGKNNAGQLGLNDEEDKSLPMELITLRTIGVKFIACGDEYSAFLTADGGVFTCGSGMYGQLGHGTICNEILPRKVTELMGNTVTQISCGSHHTMAFVPSRGRLYAFGMGISGQLGVRYSGNATTPQLVLARWVGPDGKPAAPEAREVENVLVKSLFSGGNQTFVTVVPYEQTFTPDDFRVFKRKTQILTLDPEKISACRKLEVDTMVDQALFVYLETVFCSQACINSSFLLDDEEHYCCSAKQPGVDLIKAENMFQEIARIENQSIRDVIWEGIVEYLIPSFTPDPLDIEALRCYLTLPLYHEFENPKNSHKLQGPFGKKFLALQGESLETVETWWSNSPTEYFERLVRIYKDIVSFYLRGVGARLREPRRFPEPMKIALDTLAELHKINRSVEDLKVPYDTFYLSELAEAVDIQADYIHWYSESLQLTHNLFFCNYPFLFDAEAKTTLLQADQSIQMQTAMSEAATRLITQILFSPSPGITEEQFLILNVSRDNIVQNTLDQLTRYKSVDLKKPLRVKFLGEEAEDAGGVRKEFFMLVFREVLHPKYGMFKHYEETRAIWFSQISFEDELMYFLIGLLCGLAIYNFTIIDLPFPLVLYKKLLQEKVGLMDLKGLSPRLAKSLQDILDYEEPDFEEVFSLTFAVNNECFGQVKTIPLKEKGDKIMVNQENKAEFVDLYVNFILNLSVREHYTAFHEGFHKVCGGKVLNLFHSHELMTLIVGNENYDWEEFERNTVYKNGYKKNDPTIRMFWEVFHELSLQDKRKFLLFLTGSDRIPIQGMKEIKIFIQPTADDRYLPVAHTCFNLLDLPRYGTKERLRYKLRQAIKHNQGFSLV